MIAADMRDYNYFTYGEKDSYAQPILSEEVQGQVKMAIYVTGKSVQDNINFENANYIGLTHDADISDKYVIQYGNEKLKVSYIIDAGARHYRQVFMVKI